ncbi:MAG: hypothetical protein R2708_21225 [Vicinamibacterales bacterium]
MRTSRSASPCGSLASRDDLPDRDRRALDHVAGDGHERRRRGGAAELRLVVDRVAALLQAGAMEVGARAERRVGADGDRESPRQHLVGGDRRRDAGLADGRRRPARRGGERDLGRRHLAPAAVGEPRAHLEGLAGHRRRHRRRRGEGRHRPGGLGHPGRLRRGRELQAQAGGDGLLGLPLLDAQDEERLVLAGALGDRLPDELQGRGEAGHGGRGIGHGEVGGGAAERAIHPRKLVGHALGRAPAERGVEARVAGVESVEDRAFLLGGRRQPRAHAGVVAVVGPGAGHEPAAVLRTLETQAEAGDVVERVAEIGAVLAAVDAHRPRLVLADAADVDLEGLPRTQALGNLLGIDVRVAGGLECELRDEPGRLVVAVAIALVALEARQQHPRPAHADDADDIAHHGVLAPLLERLLEALREAVVHHRREVLLVNAVVAVGDAQLLGADEPEAVEELRPDGVVARFPAVQREQGQPGAVAARQARDDAAVLVIGMRRGVHDARRRARLEDLLPGTGRACVLHGHGLAGR